MASFNLSIRIPSTGVTCAVEEDPVLAGRLEGEEHAEAPAVLEAEAAAASGVQAVHEQRVAHEAGHAHAHALLAEGAAELDRTTDRSS